MSPNLTTWKSGFRSKLSLDPFNWDRTANPVEVYYDVQVRPSATLDIEGSQFFYPALLFKEVSPLFFGSAVAPRITYGTFHRHETS